MKYAVTGAFTEACDCTVICPCWVDDDPDEGHCTGLIAWQIQDGHVNGVDVSGRQVVSVSTHSGNRHAATTSTTSVLYVDDAATDEQYEELVAAFSGRIDGPLADLAGVSGEVTDSQRATIVVGDDPAVAGQWQMLVHTGTPDEPVIAASGTPRVFDEGPEPLTLQHAALSKELGIPSDNPTVTAQQGRTLTVNVGGLPVGTLTVEGRSGMRGAFSYVFQDSGQG